MVRLDFTRGVAHHCVVLTRQALCATHDGAPTAPPSVGATHASQSSTASLQSNIVNLQASYGSSSKSLGGTPPSASPSPQPEKPVGKHVLSQSPPPTGTPAAPRAPTRTNVSAAPKAVSAAESLDALASVREDDTVKKQLVDIARRLKDELETQAHEVCMRLWYLARASVLTRAVLAMYLP